jgi:hypothetical protein
VDLMAEVQETFRGAVSCSTARSHEYLLDIGGGVFDCTVNELGLRIQHKDGFVEEEEPMNVNREERGIKGYVKANAMHNLSLVVKIGGFAVRFGDVDGRAAKGWQID